MRTIFFICLAWVHPLIAGSSSEATSTPHIVVKLVQGLANSKIDQLTSKVSIHEGKEFSYHLKLIDYLGTVQRDGRMYTIAAAKFIRSSAKGSERPPARGHSFLLVFDDSYRIASFGRLDYASYHMEGDILKQGDNIVIDFRSTSPIVRHKGWLLDGDFMPYPFADKISEPD